MDKLSQSYAAVPTKLKLIDAYLLYILLTGAIQFVYPVLFGTFPFNAFLAGFISTVASFVLAGLWCIRCWWLLLGWGTISHKRTSGTIVA